MRMFHALFTNSMTRSQTVATTTGQDGNREKIRYEMDDAGRFSTGMVFGPDGRGFVLKANTV
jgi:hypothetical protein